MEIDVIFTPGHSPGHVTYSVPEEEAIFSGDVLFQGSVGRTDLPGGDWATLLESIRTLVDSHPPETTVYPGHMGITTLGAERATNPFLAELAPRSREPPAKVAAPWLRSSRPRGAPSTCCRSSSPSARGSRTVSRRRLEAAGYGRIDTPIFEDTDLFARGVGESTDIVQKQMFTFEDQGGRSLTLRPRRPPRSAAPTSSTACRSSRSP